MMVCPFILVRVRVIVLAALGSVVLLPTTLESQGLAALARQNHTRGVLWKVESAAPGPDPSVLYLAGSVHALGRHAYPLAASFDRAFAASTTLIEEVGDAEQDAAGATLVARARLKPGRTLEKTLSAETYTRDFADEPDAYQSVIVERNHNWLPTMEKCLAGQKCFVVVGAAHLIGPDGLVALLRARGYRVTPL